VELMGLEIADDGTDSHVIASSVIVPAGGYAVLGRNAETSSNGGITLDYEYGGFFLAQAGDEVVLIQGTTEIDRVAYDDTAFPDTAGAALSLAIGSTDSVANDAGTAWCDAAFPYGGGDLGTPGLANPSCSPVSTSPGLIPDDDPAGITRTAVMDAAGCTITSVDVDIEITHPFRGDLVVDLTSPAGTTVRLHDRTGGTADDLIGNYPATLTEDGPGSLADFVGEIADGTWTLGVSDEAPVDVGNLRTWAVNVTCEVASGETPGTAIPDNDSTGITDTTTIATPVGCTVAGVRVPIEITHPWRGDLFIRLTSPAGTAVTLKNTNAIDSADDVSGEYPTTLTPAESLDAFLGEDPDGAWTLFVSDNSVLDTGTLDSWGVAVDCGRVAADDTAAPLPIPDDDPAGIDSTRLVDGACTIAGLNVDVAITHTYRGDLIVELTSPLGTVVRLKTTDSLDSADDVVGNYPYTLAPFESLGAFVGEDANGIWTLDVSDNAALDLGTLDSWQLNLDCS
jgi:subtilisin-like proprotein convertase family protein